MPYRELSTPKDEEPSEDSPQEESKTMAKVTVRGISWSLDRDLSNDGLSSNERIVKIMSRNNSEMLRKWVIAVKNKTGKADIARALLKEFHTCGATHRQKAEDMVKGMSSFFKRYESFKEKVQEQTKGRIVKYNKDGEVEYDKVSDFLQVYLEKNFPYFLDITKAFDVLYRERPDLAENEELIEEDKSEAASSDDEAAAQEQNDAGKNEEKTKRKSSSDDKGSNKLKRLKAEAEIKRLEVETKRIQFETQEKILALHAKYHEARFVGTEESRAAQLIFKNAFPSLFSQSAANNNGHHSESEVDELEEN